MMETLRKHTLLLLGASLLAFFAGLLSTFPASIAFEKIRAQLPPQLTEMISNVEGSIWNGQSTLTAELLQSRINWELNPIDGLLGGYGIVLHAHHIDHDLWLKLNPSGEKSGRLQISGTISSQLINRQLKPFSIIIDQDIELKALTASLKDEKFSNLSGTVLWQGGRVSYTAGETQTHQLPKLEGLLSSVDGTLVLNIVKAGSSKPISLITFQANGWLSLEVKPAMAGLILLPNQRVNRAGNVMDIKRKLY